MSLHVPLLNKWSKQNGIWKIKELNTAILSSGVEDERDIANRTLMFLSDGNIIANYLYAINPTTKTLQY